MLMETMSYRHCWEEAVHSQSGSPIFFSQHRKIKCYTSYDWFDSNHPLENILPPFSSFKQAKSFDSNESQKACVKTQWKNL